jgi:class 3 adenylate cyclase
MGEFEGGPQSILFAATYPDRVRSLTLYGTYPSWMRRRDYSAGLDMSVSEYSRWVDRVVGALSGVRADMEWFWDMWAPGLAAAPGFFDLAETFKPSCGPRAQRLIWEAMFEADVRSLLPTVQVPTTIVHRRGDRVAPIEGGRYLAAHIDGARLVELDGDDHFTLFPIDEITAAVKDHVTAAAVRTNERFDRRLATVLFTDIVDSTKSAGNHGDQGWAAVLERHDRVARALVTAHGGRVVKTTGDGVLATFDGPSRAVECAQKAHHAMAELGLAIRAGLHTGEIELRADEDVAGMGVHIAARVSGLANAGETIVSRTVKDLVVGSGFAFEDAGNHALKGVEDTWQCYRLAPSASPA